MIILSLFVFAILTVIHGRPTGSHEATALETVRMANDVATQNTNFASAPETVKMVDDGGVATKKTYFEVEEVDDGVKHHHELVQRWLCCVECCGFRSCDIKAICYWFWDCLGIDCVCCDEDRNKQSNGVQLGKL